MFSTTDRLSRKSGWIAERAAIRKDRFPMYHDDENVMYATSHEYGHTGAIKQITRKAREYFRTPGGRVFLAVLVGALLGVTLGAIAGSFRLAVGFGVGFGLISGLIFENEIRRHPDESGKK